MRSSFVALLIACIPAFAHASGAELMQEGSTLVGRAQPEALIQLARRLHVEDLKEYRALRRELGGLDPLNLQLLTPLGLDTTGVVWFSSGISSPKRPALHHRLVIPIRDPDLLFAFIGALSASGKIALERPDPSSPIGRLGVHFTMGTKDSRLIARLEGSELVVDLVAHFAGGSPNALEVARSYPVRPARAFSMTTGTRPRLDAPSSAAALWIDGASAQMLVDSRQRTRMESALANAEPKMKAKLRAAAQRELDQCKGFQSPEVTLFDDMAVVVPALPGGPANQVRVELAWSGKEASRRRKQGESPREWVEALEPHDPFVTLENLRLSTIACGEEAYVAMLVRAWPLALRTFLHAEELPPWLRPFSAALAGKPLKSNDYLPLFRNSELASLGEQLRAVEGKMAFEGERLQMTWRATLKP